MSGTAWDADPPQDSCTPAAGTPAEPALVAPAGAARRPRSCGPAGRAASECSLHELLLQERREREAALAALGEAVDARVRRVGEGLVAALIAQARQEREASVAALHSELEARLPRAEAAGAAGAAPRGSPREREAGLAELRGEVEARLAGLEEGPLAAALERERNERDARFALLQDELDARLAQSAEGLVSGQLRAEREAFLASLRSETERCAEALRAEAGLQGTDAEAGAHPRSLVERERREREASLAALRGEVDARFTRVTSLLEQDSQERQALRRDVDARLGGLGDGGVAALLERERQEREAALAALRGEVSARPAPCEAPPHDALLDAVRREVRGQLEEAREAGRGAEPEAEAAGSGDGRLSARQVNRLLGKQQAEAAQLEGQLERLRRDVGNSLQVLKLQVAQVEQVSSTLDMDVRILKESGWPMAHFPHTGHAGAAAPAEAPAGPAPAAREAAPSGAAASPRHAAAPNHAAVAPHHAASAPSQAGSQSQPSARELLTDRSQAHTAERPGPLLAPGALPSMEHLIARAKSLVHTDGQPAPNGAPGKPYGLSPLCRGIIAKTKTMTMGAPLAAHPPPPSVVPMNLNEYLLRDLQAEQSYEHPVGYRAEADGDRILLTHRGSGVKLCSAPLQLAGASDTDLLLYYYTDRDSFHAILEASEVLVTLLQRGKRDDAAFGAGVYMTIHAPEHFGTKSAILINLHSNAEDRASQLQHIEPHCGSADYCIPFLVRRCHVRDVMREATPEMASGAGFTAAGERARTDRDLRVVSIDPVEEAARQLEDPAAAVRARAARSLRELASRGDGRAVEALLPRLQAERDAGARAAAAGALGEVALRGDARACAALQRCLGARGDEAPVRESAALALGKVAQRGDRPTVEALARCLDGEPDRTVRASAAFVLGRVALRDDVRAIEALTYRFEDEDEDERVSAVAGQALKRLGMDVDVDDEEGIDEKACVLS